VAPYIQKHNIEMIFISLPMSLQLRIQKLMDELPDICIFDLIKASIEHDLYYLKNWSIWLDLWIIFKTVWIVLRKDNAY